MPDIPVKREMDGFHIILATIRQRVRQPPGGDPDAKRRQVQTYMGCRLNLTSKPWCQ